MFSPDDTIVAIATPPGRGGIGMVRISGPMPAVSRRNSDVRRALTPRTPRSPRSARRRTPADEVVATFFPRRIRTPDRTSSRSAPTVARFVSRGIVERAIGAGARLAEPGEVHAARVPHGKRDLVQAEAVGDLIDAVTPLQARTAIRST
jgi:tRNA modification GTPase